MHENESVHPEPEVSYFISLSIQNILNFQYTWNI